MCRVARALISRNTAVRDSPSGLHCCRRWTQRWSPRRRSSCPGRWGWGLEGRIRSFSGCSFYFFSCLSGLVFERMGRRCRRVRPATEYSRGRWLDFRILSVFAWFAHPVMAQPDQVSCSPTSPPLDLLSHLSHLSPSGDISRDLLLIPSRKSSRWLSWRSAVSSYILRLRTSVEFLAHYGPPRNAP